VTDALKVALVVPNYRYRWNDERHCRIKGLRTVCKKGAVDLVVFPEGYEPQAGRKIQSVADEWSNYLGVPTIVGIGTDDGFQTAVYSNPSPARGETATHVYVKHSTAERLAFEWPDYTRQRASMFRPIVLKGTKVAVQICHDMFFGLLGQRMKLGGAEVFIDITGGGVNLRKWTNVIQGRSLELAAPFLCTMAKRPNENGVSRAVAFRSGKPSRPAFGDVGREGFGGYDVHELPRDVEFHPGTNDEDGQQAYTEKRYRDITVAVGATTSADISVDPASGSLHLRRELPPSGSWRGLESRVGRVGVLELALDVLWDGLALYQRVPKKGAFDQHIVVYFSSTEPAAFDDVLALMKLRAVEHRVGVVAIAGDRREVLKTNRYKNIQRFNEVNGVFGLNAEFLGGTWSTVGTTPALGIPERFFDDYLALAPPR
jgi:hypothetical protein